MPNDGRPVPGDLPPGLRQRQRADGTWRLWWEPSKARRAAGLETVELDPSRPTAAVREVEKLNRKADRLMGVARPTAGRATDAPRSIDEIAHAWLASPKVTKKSEATRRNYAYDVRRICDQWEGQQARALTRPAIVLWYDTLYEDAGARMAQRLVRTLGTLLKWAALRGYVQTNPARDLGMETPEGRARVVSWTEYDALQEAATTLDMAWLRMAMDLAIFQGQRPKDIREARLSDFDLAALEGATPTEARLVWTIVRSKDRKRKVSRLVVNRAVERWLLPRWRHAENRDTLVIADAKGRFITNSRLSHAFQLAREAAAKTLPTVADARFSDLRRTFSHTAYRNGIDPANVDDALGNTAGEDPTLRQVYMPASDQAAARAIDAVARPIFPNPKPEDTK